MNALRSTETVAVLKTSPVGKEDSGQWQGWPANSEVRDFEAAFTNSTNCSSKKTYKNDVANKPDAA